jgi:hypothetical protein
MSGIIRQVLLSHPKTSYFLGNLRSLHLGYDALLLLSHEHGAALALCNR